MRITIVQSEIEEAIRNHILDQITVNEGMEIDIKLRATRGAEGYQADIDIHPAGSKSPEREEEPAPENVEKTPSKPLGIEQTVTTAKRGRKPAAQKAEEAPAEPEIIIEDKVEPEMADEGPAEVQPETEAPASKLSLFGQKKDAAEPEAVEPAGETKSIFGGLKRPVNA
jgi:hypothetical protein